MSEIIVDATEVYEALGIFDDLLRELASPTNEALALLQERMRKYPAAPAGSTYTRTGDLGNSWEQALILSGGILGQVISRGPDYNLFVQGEDDQAWMHAGRWQTEGQVIEQEGERIVAFFAEYLQERLSR